MTALTFIPHGFCFGSPSSMVTVLADAEPGKCHRKRFDSLDDALQFS